jgi:hypothetical protein
MQEAEAQEKKSCQIGCRPDIIAQNRWLYLICLWISWMVSSFNYKFGLHVWCIIPAQNQLPEISNPGVYTQQS